MARARSDGTGLQYELVSRLIHQPRLLRAAARLLQRKPSLARVLRVVASRATVVAAFERTASFSSTARESGLRAGEFVIGMDSGRRQRAERAFLKRVLPSPAQFRELSVAQAQRGVAAVRASGAGTFELIDFMVGVAWRSLRHCFGPAIDPVAGADPDNPEMPSPGFVEELRCLGAQLIISAVAPPEVRARADACADELNRRVKAQVRALAASWSAHQPGDEDAILRNAVGLMWVSHPATVQAGALLMQELLGRRALLDTLTQRVRALEQGAWTDATLRDELRGHVLELLRFRPPFPILNRDVPREAWFDVGAKVPAGHAPAGSQLTLLTIGALFDRAAMGKKAADADAYDPEREFIVPEDRYLMFGGGARACIAGHHVVEILTSALTGLLTLDRLRWADPWYDRMGFDGPTICRLRLRYDA